MDNAISKCLRLLLIALIVILLFLCGGGDEGGGGSSGGGGDVVYNAFGVPVAAGILYPFVGNLHSPIFVAAAMSLSSASAVGNAL